jgi:3-oxoacyl-(acyl-carrier-protein) synthase
MQRIVITGVGTINAAGCGAERFWNSLQNGSTTPAAPTLYDAGKLGDTLVFEAQELDGAGVVYRKGVSIGERGMHMAVSSAKLALENSGHSTATLQPERVGIAFGAALDSLRALGAFHARTHNEGPRYADPGLFPNTGMSAAACQISIALGFRAFNATISNGMTAGLDAIAYGADMLLAGRADTVIVGGVYALSWETHLGFHLQGALRSNASAGFTLGEGAASLILETMDSAQARGATPLAELLGYANVFDPTPLPGYNPQGRGAYKAMRQALERSAILPEQVDLILANASGDRAADLMEKRALRKVFGLGSVPSIASVKAVCGETYSAAGAFQTVAAALSLSRREPLRTAFPGSHQAPATSVTKPRLRTALINSFNVSGASTSLVLAAA